jgi:DNA-binding transcriptional LysR family regulator
MREIEAFLAVAEELHVGRATDRVRDVHLTRQHPRTGRGTPGREAAVRAQQPGGPADPAGHELYAGLQPAYIQTEHTLEDVRCAGAVGAGVLRTGFSVTVTEKPRLEPISTFESRYPDCRVVASYMPTPGLFRRLGKEWPVHVFVTWMPMAAPPIEPSLYLGEVIHRVPRAVIPGEKRAGSGGSLPAAPRADQGCRVRG